MVEVARAVTTNDTSPAVEVARSVTTNDTGKKSLFKFG